MSDVVSLIAQQAQPFIDQARQAQPLIRDIDVKRLMGAGLTLDGIRAQLFRMVTLDPFWAAEAIEADRNEASGPLSTIPSTGNSAPRTVPLCRVQKPGNKVTEVTI